MSVMSNITPWVSAECPSPPGRITVWSTTQRTTPSGDTTRYSSRNASPRLLSRVVSLTSAFAIVGMNGRQPCVGAREPLFRGDPEQLLDLGADVTGGSGFEVVHVGDRRQPLDQRLVLGQRPPQLAVELGVLDGAPGHVAEQFAVDTSTSVKAPSLRAISIVPIAWPLDTNGRTRRRAHPVPASQARSAGSSPGRSTWVLSVRRSSSTRRVAGYSSRGP